MEKVKAKKPEVLNLDQGSDTVDVYSRVLNSIRFTVWDSQGDGKAYVNSTPKFNSNGKPIEVVINGTNSSAFDENCKMAITKVSSSIWNYIKEVYVTHPFIASNSNQSAQIFSVNSIQTAKDKGADTVRNITEHLTEDVRKQMYDTPNELLNNMR